MEEVARARAWQQRLQGAAGQAGAQVCVWPCLDAGSVGAEVAITLSSGCEGVDVELSFACGGAHQLHAHLHSASRSSVSTC